MPDLALQVTAALVDAGVDQGQVALVTSHAELVQRNDQGLWLVAPGQGESWVVGGVERSRMVVYDQYETLPRAANALAHLTSSPAPVRRLDQAESDAALLAARDLGSRIQSAAAAATALPTPIELRPGDVLDRFGHESGAATFVLGTTLPARSLSPTEVTQAYHTYRVRGTVTSGVTAGPVAPWFGQPGGGLKVQLPRSVRWLCDAGVLEEYYAEPHDTGRG